jgi:hypothetical protein
VHREEIYAAIHGAQKLDQNEFTVTAELSGMPVDSAARISSVDFR